MKQTPLLASLAVLVLVTLALPSAYAALSDNPTYTVTLLQYEPTPAQPGDIVEAYIQITNTATIASPQTTIVIDSSFPFTPVSAADARKSIGSIAPGSTFVTRVKLSVDSSAGNGVYDLPVQLTTNGQDYQTNDLAIEVRAPNAVLSVVSAKTTPAEAIPGNPTTFIVTVANTQASTLRDVTVSLDLTDTDLSTVGTTSKQTLARLDGNSETSFRFTLLPDPEAQSGVVRLPLTFTFLSTAGETITQTESAGVIVHAAPEVSVLVDRVTRDTTTNAADVLVRVVNKGLSQVKFAELTITDGENYDIVDGRDVVYVGNIDSDDFQTAEYSIASSSEMVTLTGVLTYRDALNQPFSVPVQVTVDMPAATNGGASPLVWVVLIVLVIGGVIIWRRRKKK
jgi:hypothetical protein